MFNPFTIPNPALWTSIALLTQQLMFGKFMSVGYRLKSVMMDKEKFKALLDSKEYKVTHAAQLNNAEWTPSFVAGLLFLHSVGKGDNIYLCALTLASCMSYCVVKVFSNGKPTPVIAVARYSAFSFMIYEMVMHAKSL